MINKCLDKVRDQGLAYSILAALRYPSPPSLDKRLSFSQTLLAQETPPSLSGGDRIRMWRYGFYPKSYLLYDFSRYNPDDYITDLDERFCWDINEPHADLLNDKQKFYQLMDANGFSRYIPDQLGVVEKGELQDTEVDFLPILRQNGRIVVKSIWGGGGNDVHICSWDGESYYRNGEQIAESSLEEWFSNLTEHVVTEYCEQAAYARTIFPDTPNTIRMVTMHPDNGDPFIARTVHRIGSTSSGAVDNWSQGGLSSQIYETGVLTSAVRYKEGRVSWHDIHPETGAQIEGVEVPHWKNICETILSIVESIPKLRYVGWDIIVTDDGFKIIEGNSNPDAHVLQPHGPLLLNDKIREFYREHGIVS